MTSQEMLVKFRADGSYERTITELMDDAVRLKLAKRGCMKMLVRLQKHFIDAGMQGSEPEFVMLRAAIENLSEGDVRIIPMSVTP